MMLGGTKTFCVLAIVLAVACAEEVSLDGKRRPPLSPGPHGGPSDAGDAQMASMHPREPPSTREGPQPCAGSRTFCPSPHSKAVAALVVSRRVARVYGGWVGCQTWRGIGCGRCVACLGGGDYAPAGENRCSLSGGSPQFDAAVTHAVVAARSTPNAAAGRRGQPSGALRSMPTI